jgi:hypothetical protein
VARHRERLDAKAPLGISAHITALFPFMPPQTINPTALAELEHLPTAVRRFHFQLDHHRLVRRGRAMTRPHTTPALPRPDPPRLPGLPAFPPLKGQFDDVIPHLTIGHGHLLKDLRAAEQSV